jgi:hypothetical protein
MRTYSLWKSRTFWGAVLIAIARVLNDPTPLTAVEALGIIVAAAGARGAVAKNGAGR